MKESSSKDASPLEETLEEIEELESYIDSKKGAVDNATNKTFKNRRIKNITLNEFIVQTKSSSLPSKRSATGKQIVEFGEIRNELPSNPESLLDYYVIQLLHKIKGKQDVNWKNNETKTRSHRHIICGLHETLKHLLADNIKLILIARNIDDEYVNGSKCKLYQTIFNASLIRKIPLIFTSSKKNLSKVVKKHPYINCVGVMRVEGFEDSFNIIIETWKNAGTCIAYHMDQSSLFA